LSLPLLLLLLLLHFGNKYGKPFRSFRAGL
jgi:hypothetical protein